MIRRFFTSIFFILIIGLAVCGYFTYKYFELKKQVAESESSTTAIQYKID